MRIRLIHLSAAGLRRSAGYFGYHLEIGDHGLEGARQSRAAQRSARRRARGLKEVKDRLERDVALLRPESLDPDMLDERARAILNLAHPDDLIMLKRRQPCPRRSGSIPRR